MAIKSFIKYWGIFCLLALNLFVGGCSDGETLPADQSESTFVDSLLINMYDSMFVSPESAEQTFRNAQKAISDSISYYKLELFAAFSGGLQGRIDEAMDVNDKVLAFCHAHAGSEALEAMCWNHRNALFLALGRRDSALVCLSNAYDALNRSDDKREMESVCINLADLNRQEGHVAEASMYYHRALRIADSTYSDRARFSIYMGLAQVYIDLYNFRMAHHYLDEARRDTSIRLEYEKYFYYNTLGNCYYYEKRYPEALKSFRNAYDFAVKFSQPSITASVEANMGEIFTLLGRLDSASVYLARSASAFSSDNDGEVMFYLNSLQASLALKEGNLKRADSLLSLPYDYSSVRPAYLNLHNQRLMEYFSKKGDYSKAYAYRVKVDEYDDSIRSVRHMANLAEMDYRYSNDTTLLRRNADLAESRADIARQSNVIILISTALVILLLLVLVAYVYVKRKNDRRYNEQLRQLARLRMENVRNRISPHYMFNVINAVMPLMRQHTDLSRIMQLFVHVLRGNLVVSDSISVSLDDEIRLVKDFVSLRGETSSSVPRVEWHVDTVVQPSVHIPSMSIQIPVENALKYAFASGIDDSSLISVDVSDVDSKGVLIHIVDNGAGLSSTSRLSASRGTGNGLKTLYSTVDLLNVRNASKMKISIVDMSSAEPSSHGTDFQLFVPYDYKFEI